MSEKKNLWTVLAAAGAAAFAIAGAPSARAGTYPLTTCDFSTGCVSGATYGSVSVTDIGGGNGVQVTLNLPSGDVFNLPNGPGSGQPILFDIPAGVGTVANVSGPQGSSATFAAGSNYNTPMHDDGTGYWTNWISCTSGCGTGSGTSAGIPAQLTFQILGNGISTANLPFTLNTPNGNGTGLWFGTDIGVPTSPGATTYYTGDVGAPLAVVPLPPSALLLLSALAVAGLLLARSRPGQRPTVAA